MLSIAIALAGVPPPVEGDDRTAILYTVNHVLELVGTGTSADLAAVLDPTGRMVIVNRLDGDEKIIVRPMQEFIEKHPNPGAGYVEKIGIPTVLQRGSLARVWAPYAFWMGGKKSHCGIDDFQLVRRDGQWVVTDLSFTMEPTDTCAALGAPESPR